MHPQLAAAFQPGQSLLQQVAQQSLGEFGGTVQSTQSAFDQAVGGITADQQRFGMRFDGFSQPEFARHFGTGALPALALLKQAQQEAAMQNRGLLAQLSAARGETGLQTGEARAKRLQDERQAIRSRQQERQITEQDIAADLEARRIQRQVQEARQRAAESSQLAAQQQAQPSKREAFIIGLARAAAAGDNRAAISLRQIKADPWRNENMNRYYKLYGDFARVGGWDG